MAAGAVAAVGLGVNLACRSLSASERRAARAADEHRALHRVAAAVADGRPADEIVALVAREAAIVLGADGAGVLRRDGGDLVLAGVYQRAADARVLPIGSRFPLSETGAIGDVLAANEPRVVRTGLSSAAAASKVGALAIAPIHVPGGAWGALTVTTSDPAGLAGDAVERVMEFSALVATAIDNAEQRERLADQAFTDPLTGLANHRAFHERLAGETHRAQRHQRDLTLVLVDVDTFKAVNDGAGHEAGDRVLADVAGRLRAITRAGDLLARIGGDEFAWLLPETTAADARALVERARAAVAAAPVAGSRMTISAGICDLARAANADELFRLADGALYWSKAHGRDLAQVYDPETVRELSAAQRAEQLARHQALLGIGALARAIDAKDPNTQQHSMRVAEMACALARARGWSEERVRRMHEAAVVHDVGKIGIADAILLKPSRLTDAEYAEVKRHAALGAQIVDDVLSPEQVEWIRHHHERPDGGGYPDALTGEALSEGAALLALADAFDVMTAARAYSTAKPYDQALAECRALIGRQFTADAVAALEALPVPVADPA
jgi:diguanylate cyclase (GGDEF)-like protein